MKREVEELVPCSYVYSQQYLFFESWLADRAHIQLYCRSCISLTHRVRPYFEQLFVVYDWQSRLISLEEERTRSIVDYITIFRHIYSRGGFTSEWNFFCGSLSLLFCSWVFFEVQWFSSSSNFCIHITKGVETSNNGHILPELQFHDILTRCFPILRILGCHPTWIAWFAFLHFQNCRNKMIQFQPAYSLALCACVLLLSQKALLQGRQRSLSSQHTWTFLQP